MSTFGDLMKKAEEQGSSFAMIPANHYVCKCIESEYKQSSNGKPQIKTRWEVLQGPEAGYKGLWNYFTLTVDNPNAMSIFYRQMNALGLTGEYMQTLGNLDPDTAMKHIAQALMDRTGYLQVVQDAEWQNNKIKAIKPIPPEFQQGGATPPDPFGAAAASPAAPAPAPQTPPAPAPAPAPTQGPAPATPPPPPF